MTIPTHTRMSGIERSGCEEDEDEEEDEEDEEEDEEAEDS